MSNPKPLLESAISAYKAGNLMAAKTAANRVVQKYPDTPASDAADKILSMIEQKKIDAKKKQEDKGSEKIYSNEDWNDAPVSSLAAASSVTRSPGRYSTARMMAAFFAFIGWVLVALGGAIALSTMKDYGVPGVLMGFGFVFFGLLQVMGAQVLRATVDTADNSYRILAAIER